MQEEYYYYNPAPPEAYKRKFKQPAGHAAGTSTDPKKRGGLSRREAASLAANGLQKRKGGGRGKRGTASAELPSRSRPSGLKRTAAESAGKRGGGRAPSSPAGGRKGGDAGGGSREPPSPGAKRKLDPVLVETFGVRRMSEVKRVAEAFGLKKARSPGR